MTPNEVAFTSGASFAVGTFTAIPAIKLILELCQAEDNGEFDTVDRLKWRALGWTLVSITGFTYTSAQTLVRYTAAEPSVSYAACAVIYATMYFIFFARKLTKNDRSDEED